MTCAGILPPEWSGMLQLQYLDLAVNNISGTLPVEWGQQGAFAELVSVNLFYNQLTGEYPQSGLDV